MAGFLWGDRPGRALGSLRGQVCINGSKGLPLWQGLLRPAPPGIDARARLPPRHLASTVGVVCPIFCIFCAPGRGSGPQSCCASPSPLPNTLHTPCTPRASPLCCAGGPGRASSPQRCCAGWPPTHAWSSRPRRPTASRQARAAAVILSLSWGVSLPCTWVGRRPLGSYG